eukprot:4736700-Prymnesium_polylepis.1
MTPSLQRSLVAAYATTSLRHPTCDAAGEEGDAAAEEAVSCLGSDGITASQPSCDRVSPCLTEQQAMGSWQQREAP